MRFITAVNNLLQTGQKQSVSWLDVRIFPSRPVKETYPKENQWVLTESYEILFYLRWYFKKNWILFFYSFYSLVFIEYSSYCIISLAHLSLKVYSVGVEMSTPSTASRWPDTVLRRPRNARELGIIRLSFWAREIVGYNWPCSGTVPDTVFRTVLLVLWGTIHGQLIELGSRGGHMQGKCIPSYCLFTPSPFLLYGSWADVVGHKDTLVLLLFEASRIYQSV